MILAQIGWGESGLVEQASRDGSVDGAVLSPRHVAHPAMAARASELHSQLGPQGLLLFDPQFHGMTMPGASLLKLQSYPYYAGGLSRSSFSPAEVNLHAQAVIDYQSALTVDRWVSPTVLFSGFNDNWSQIALSLAQASISARDAHGNEKKPLLVSLVFDEQALLSKPALDEFLDSVSTLDTDGFYIVVRRSDSEYPALFDERALANLLYMTYTLGSVHEFEVIHAYTDFVGALLVAVGADAICTGWHQGLRQFGPHQWLAAGGRSPRPRYTSRQLANSLLVNPELSTIYSKGALSKVLSGTGYDSVMKSGPANAPWPNRVSFLHHWKSLAALLHTIPVKRPIKERLAAAEQMVDAAEAVYGSLVGAGLPFRPPSGPRNIPCWRNAIRSFRLDARV